MRWAIGFLVVINVTIFLWGNLTQNSAPTDRRTDTDPTASGFETSPQAADMKTTASAPMASSVAEHLGSPRDGVDVSPLPPFELGQAVETGPAPATAEQSPDLKSAKQTHAEGTEPIPDLSSSDNEVLSVESEQLVSSDSSGTHPSASDSSSRLYCGQIGPVSEATDAESVRSRLAEAGLQPILQEIVKTKSKGFWVLIPPLPDQEEGKRTLARLQKKGIKDTWLFKRGELNNAISLGLYNRRNNAELRRKQLQSLGFEVEVWPRVEPVSHFQVSFSGTGPAVLDRVRRLIPRFESRDSACSQASAASNEL